MIRLIPYQRFEIKTRFSQNVTLGKLDALLAPFVYVLIVALFNIELNRAKKLLYKQLEVDSFSMP
jgi:hypothetical protein